MKDSIQDDKWNRAVSLFTESVLRPDFSLRQEAYEQECFLELMNIREMILEHLEKLRK